jgi:hypothetical protein
MRVTCGGSIIVASTSTSSGPRPRQRSFASEYATSGQASRVPSTLSAHSSTVFPRYRQNGICDSAARKSASVQTAGHNRGGAWKMSPGPLNEVSTMIANGNTNAAASTTTASHRAPPRKTRARARACSTSAIVHPAP